MDERFQPKNRTPTRGMRLKRISAPMDNLNTTTWYPIQWSGSMLIVFQKKEMDYLDSKKLRFAFAMSRMALLRILARSDMV
jgi:hypothetical protein